MNDSFEDRMSAADTLIDRAAQQIQDAEPAPEVVSAAADRVWEQLAGKHNARRGMKIVRGDAPLDIEPQVVAKTQQPSSNRWGLWALAALLVVGIGVAQVLVRQMWPSGPSATVKTVDGQLFRVEPAAHVPLAIGDEIREGEVIRSGRDGGAVVTLQDGSLVELSPRSELSIDEGAGGTTLELSRGNVIVEAAEQRSRHLYVSTEDCLVSVTGTIFSVNHGTKGSRVSVIEGEVRVDHGGTEDVLHPGDQITTHRLLSPLSVADEIAWSQNVDSYLQILREYTDLKQQLKERVTHPDLRFSTRLLDLMPADTVLYVAAPNVAETVTETHRVFQERLAESPALQEWLAQNAGGFQNELDEVMQVFAELGNYLGQEVAVGGQSGDAMGAVVLAEVLDAAGLRAFVERQIEEHGGNPQEGPIFIDDPSQAGEKGLWIWFHGDLAVGSHSGQKLRQVAAFLGGESNPFVGTAFHDSVAALYGEGAEFIVAADIHQILGTTMEFDTDAERQETMAVIGVDNARHMMFEQKRLNEKTQHRMVMTFDEARRGVTSWLASPAPMGGLSFVSPDAKVALGIVFKDPALLLDDLLEMTGEIPSGLREFEERYSLSLRNDVAAAIGGELVVAVDGPLLPEPAIKVIVEVYDPARFQWALEQALAEANTQLSQSGVDREPLAIQQSDVRGRTYYTLPAEVVDIHYTFVEGYLVMASNRALIDQAIRYRDSGFSITESAKFNALLPQDGRNNFSALAYQDFTTIAQTIANQLANAGLTEEQKSAIEALQFEEPLLGYAYGEEKRIIVAAASDGSFLQSLLMRAFGLKNPAGLESLFGQFFQGA